MKPLRILHAYVGAYIVFLYVPVALIPLFSFNDAIQAAFPLKGVTLEWYRTLVATPAIGQALRNSLIIAAAAATITTICATTIAYLDVFPRPVLSRLVSGLARLPILIPGVIVGIALLILVNLAGLGPSRPAIVLGHVLVCLPASVTVIRARFAAIPRSLAEAAADLGASDWIVFRRAILPLAASAIGSAFTLAFLTSFDEFIVAYFLAGTEPTLPLYIWSQLRFPKSLPVVMALGTLILLVSVLLAGLAELLRRRSRV
ncbi:ABC transporter permease [Thalassovita mangrovi]|uniref:ABC transporter permease subunit n=1 Tax=Thalassovita mangrovi TaxID=2692236 RepID=A0A6L8LP47_9RHOB|nr:ABC transporter permease [Thalassovita mangrovi]MYM56380.1 ABC transporter permease subunit [Thalassovita mangrovi]